MHRRIWFGGILTLAIVATALYAHRSFGLTPPLDDAELQAQSDLIIVGEVGAPLQCAGRAEQKDIGLVAHYVIPVTIREVTKGIGKPGDILTLRFTHVFYKRGYTGDQDADHYPGEVGKYHLQRLKEEGHVRTTHWSGVTVMKEGKGSLPKCPISSKQKT